jgi:polysaccharide deacetylase 2 family uncharacterized protein YibQ
MILSRRRLVSGAIAGTVFAPAIPAFAQSMMMELDPSQAVSPPPATGVPSLRADGLPPWRSNAVAAPALDGRPAITLVIDDMGVMHPHTAQAAALPGPLTLAWFPFARDLPAQIAAAAARGHEAMLHMPMQAHSDSIAQTGPDPLRIDLSPLVNQTRLRDAIAAVPSIVGVNNHMGSVATRDPMLMELVAREVRAHGLLFLDSVVVTHSVALSCAELAGVPAAARDVFIDNAADAGAIREQLATTEAFARRHGHAIAIAHPRPLTLQALEAWLPTLRAKGFALWPLSATVAWRNNLDPVPTAA